MVLKEAGTVSRREIEAKLVGVGDYVKMDYLQACLKKNMDFDTKKFVLVSLANIYESRKMNLEAGKMIRMAAEINTTFEGKMNDFMKSMDLLIKGGNFDEAEASFAKALACADGIQKDRLKSRRKEFYKRQATEYMSKDKRKNAMETYEKYLKIPDLSADERKQAQNELLRLYEKLGKITEYNTMKRTISQPYVPPQPKKEEVESRNSDFSLEELGIF